MDNFVRLVGNDLSADSHCEALAIVLYGITHLSQQLQLLSNIGKFRFQFFNQFGCPVRFGF